MGKVWVLHTETKGTGAEMVPLEKVLQEPGPGRAPVLAPERRKRSEPPAPRAPWRSKVVDVMTRRVVAEGVDARTTVDLLKSFRSVVHVSVYAWDQAGAGDRSRSTSDEPLWSFRDRAAQVAPRDRPDTRSLALAP